MFDIQRRPCLRPNWSRRGIGYFLLQQHCSCPSGILNSCPGGWGITLAVSRFLASAEQHYAAIEGEALAVAWGLEQTRYFTQGCDNHAADATSRHPSQSCTENVLSQATKRPRHCRVSIDVHVPRRHPRTRYHPLVSSLQKRRPRTRPWAISYS